MSPATSEVSGWRLSVWRSRSAGGRRPVLLQV